MGHTWVQSVPDGPHVGPMNLANRDIIGYSRTQVIVISYDHIMVLSHINRLGVDVLHIT